MDNDDDDDEISFLVEETGIPGGNYRPTAQEVEGYEKVGGYETGGVGRGGDRTKLKGRGSIWRGQEGLECDIHLYSAAWTQTQTQTVQG